MAGFNVSEDQLWGKTRKEKNSIKNKGWKAEGIGKLEEGLEWEAESWEGK